MGHYDSCYEEEDRQRNKWRQEREDELAKKYEKRIKEIGIARFLAEKEVWK